MRGRKPAEERAGSSGINRNEFTGPAIVQGGSANEQQIGDRYYTTYNFQASDIAARSGPAHPEALHEPDPWVNLVEHSAAWRHLEPGSDSDALKQHAMTVAFTLARLYDEARDGLIGDPWHDPGLVERFTYRVDWLFNNVWSETPVVVSPAEATLLSLLPLLHHTRATQRAARHLHIDPENLTPHDRMASEERVRYDRFLRTHDRLVRRASQSPLDGKDDGRHQIAWWLYHRWLATDPTLARNGWADDLLAAAGIPGTVLADFMDSTTMTRLLTAPSVSPHALCGIDGQPFLHRQRWTTVGQGPKEQRVREQLVGVVFTVAHGLAIEATVLPPVIVQHLCDPGAVKLNDLHHTLSTAQWDQRANGKERQLRAHCHHNAVAAALREHARRLDGLLRAVHRAGDDGSWPAELHELPVFVGGDTVVEVDSEGRELPPRDAVAFRFDEGAVQELLVGERLYRDPALAIRELYQNALDACRYRRAREQAHAQRLGRSADSTGYKGEIEFTHGFTACGRAFLSCRDNGVGMGEEELTGVFAEAGARFADSAAYLAEKAEWAELPEPVSVQPNSRFGIGVLSYFMLADEIKVSTCRLRKDGSPGRRLTVHITGPGQFFQVVEEQQTGMPGTTVTLYLRDDAQDHSAAETLHSLLGYTEFRTQVIRGDGTTEVWEPETLTARARPSWEAGGIDAYGTVVRWRGQVEYQGSLIPGQVMWCEYGGGVLVDGLHAQPSDKQRIGVLAGSRAFGGAMVNLDGGWDVTLSVDRTQILKDVSQALAELLEAAMTALVRPGSDLLTFRWLCAVALYSPMLADMISAAAADAELPMTIPGEESTNSAARQDCFPPDVELAGRQVWTVFQNFDDEHVLIEITRSEGRPPDHIFLWRVLARRWPVDLDRLSTLVPELVDVGKVRLARPTDAYVLRGEESHWIPDGEWGLKPGWVLSTAANIGMTPRALAMRAAELGMEVSIERYSDDLQPDPLDLALLSTQLDGITSWLATDVPVPVAHLLDARFRRGISLDDAERRLTAYGFSVPATGHLPNGLGPSDAVLLSRGLSGQAPWISEIPVEPGHVVAAALALATTTTEIHSRLESFGLAARSIHGAGTVDRDDVALLTQWTGPKGVWLSQTKTVPPGKILEAATQLGRAPAELAERLREFGFALPPVIPPLHGRAEKELVLLGRDLDGIGPWLDVEENVPAAHVLLAARETGLPAAKIVDYLMGLGFTIVGDVRPSAGDLDLIFNEDSRTLGLSDLQDSVPLHHLLGAARRTRRSITDVVHGLRKLGLKVQDPTQMIRTALLRVPLEPGKIPDSGPAATHS